jgi:hypothetical protein
LPAGSSTSSSITLARAELDDARVPTLALGEARSDVREQPVHDVVGAERGKRLPPRVQVTALAERDQLLGERLHRLGLRFRRLDAAVLDQRAGEVGVEGFAVRGVAAELLA